MDVGQMATYGHVTLHNYGQARLTFECLHQNSGESRFENPIEQWLFEVTIDAEELDDAGEVAYILVSIVDKTADRIPSPFHEDWETCHEVLVRGSSDLDGYDGTDETVFEPFRWPTQKRGTNTIAEYSTEQASLTGALFRVLEDVHMLESYFERPDTVEA